MALDIFYASHLSVKKQTSFCCTLTPQFKRNDAIIEEAVQVMKVIKCLSFAPKPFFSPHRINDMVPVIFIKKKKKLLLCITEGRQEVT